MRRRFRWAIPLALTGFSVTGVDKTKFLLDMARGKARSARVRVERVQADMRDFVRAGAFVFAISMLTSFGYFDDKDQDSMVLTNVFDSPRPGGVCLLELIGEETLSRIYRPTTSDRLADASILVQRRDVVDGWSRLRNEWILIRNGRSRTFRFYHSIYSGQELRELLEQAGFENVELFGSLAGSEYGVNAQRLIAIGRKLGSDKHLTPRPRRYR